MFVDSFLPSRAAAPAAARRCIINILPYTLLPKLAWEGTSENFLFSHNLSGGGTSLHNKHSSLCRRH